MRSLLRSGFWVWLALSGCDKPAPAAEVVPPAAQPASTLAASSPPSNAIDALPVETPPSTAPETAEVTASGLATQVLTPGTGDKRPRKQDRVLVNFTSWNSSGKIVDGSAQRGGSVTFEVEGVIAGWGEALQLMRVGEKRRLWVPDHLTYPGRPGPARPPAVFEIELLEIDEGVGAEAAPPDLTAAPQDATKTASGLTYKVLAHEAARESERPHSWDRVTVRFAGWTQNGEMFDSSKREPERFELSKVIPGWQEALPLLSLGDKARLWVPEALAYRGRQGEPRGTLVYDIELVSIERRPEPPRAPEELNAPPPKATRTRSGLAYRFLHQSGSTRRPGPQDRVTVNYAAWTSDGKLFDSTALRGRPATVPIGQLIKGWAEGLQLMAEGDKAQLWIPEKLAYAGRDGSPRGMLVYEVELLQLIAAP
jgi:FKBP-type peptidyl-prolyl cis-trans isomerase